MSPRRVGAVVRRIVAQFRRDHRSLGLLFIVPVAVLALLGWVIRDQQTPTTRVVVVNDAGPTGSVLSAALRSAGAAGSLSVDGASSEADARAALVDRRADVAVVIPAGYGTGASTVRVVTLGLNPGEDGTHLGRFGAGLTSAAEELLPGAIRDRIPSLERSTVYGPSGGEADLLDTFAPVFVGYFAYFFVFILTGISFLRERIGGTLERLLATPVTRAEIVLGYSIGFGVFATIQVAIVLAFTLLVLGVPSAGSPLLAYLIALLLGLGAVSLGIFLSTFGRTELQILQFIPVVIVPQGLLGGIFWPFETLPPVLEAIARLLPVTYAVEGLRAVMIAGADLTSATVLLDVGVLAAIAALFVVLAAATIRREIA